MTKTARQSGFTLIELMIAVAIVAILARIAFSSYSRQVIRGNRADAKQVLMQGTQAMERAFVTNGTAGYSCDTITNNSVLNRSPSGSADAARVYAITCSGTASTFTLTATPQTGKANASDGTLTINQASAKGGTSTEGWAR